MKSKIGVPFFCLCVLVIFSVVIAAQDNQQPMTKQEIISLLKKTAPRNISQAEIASEVEQRGIAFSVDDALLNEFQQYGAKTFLLDAIKRAASAAAQPVPHLQTAPVEDEEARKRAEAEMVAKLPLLEQARIHALDYTEELPNFIVAQTVTRYVRSPQTRDWRLEDTLEMELTYIAEKGEQHKLLRVNGKPVQQSYEGLGGSTSSGEFGALLASLFAPQSRTDFKEIKKDVMNGKNTMIYDFMVRKANSNNMITDKPSGQKTIAGYTGSIWIDLETKQVLRIETAAEGLPADFPVTMAENSVDYDWISISGERYLLPVRAELIIGNDRQRNYSRNVIEFRNYKKFEGKIVVQ